MLEITGDDIAGLNDEDLRSLVGRLSESELQSRRLSTSCVTWGGNQDAVDGGIDVRVKIDNCAPPGGFVPRANIGFQVKKTDFTPGLIVPEMCPSGHLRPSIRGLIDVRGAYIIVSSGSDVSDSALTARLDAMRSAVRDQPGSADLHLDFYDRNRIATWTRSHLGLVVWVRQKIGRSIPGWQSYGSWATLGAGVEDEYLLDDNARLHIGISDESGINVTQGINRIRAILSRARGVVRLAGLSGVGKTRLVQALFDVRVGDDPLDPALVIYTDMSDNPSPQPVNMISDLVNSRQRAIVVIDNCAPDLHRRITEVCRSSESLISAITVEYDVQEDEPEGSEAFRLEPSSAELVSKLIARRFPAMTQLDADRIAESSGGNARVALAIAKTVEHNESVAGLHDEELFRRLFHQRQEHDDGLMQAAQACALLYSFRGEPPSGDEAELPNIAALIGMNAQQLYAKVARLKLRDLVQSRSIWRAILPHAVANRLATMALREIPLESIEAQFNTERMLKSFSRRLGYLHASDDAQRIAEKWLAKGQRLADVGRLTQLGLAMFVNIAPVLPEATLTAIEDTLSGPSTDALIRDQERRRRIASILHSIAYDRSLFDRCVAAMIPLAIVEPPDNNSHPVTRDLEELFHIRLSGTHAAVEQRAAVVDGLLRSHDPGIRSLGLRLLSALLKADRFLPSHTFDFGARNRNYGYEPSTGEEESHWFVTTLQLARQFASKNDETAEAIRSMVADSIWNIWFIGPNVQEQFEAMADEIATDGYWQEAWITVRSILSRHRNKADDTALDRLRDFECRLRPKNAAEQVRAVVLSQSSRLFEYAEMDEGDEIDTEKPMSKYEKADAAAEELGKTVCGDQTLFTSLLPELVSGNGARLVSFGRGLALAAKNHRNVWDQLAYAVAKTEDGKRNVGALFGFLSLLSTVDQQLSESLLEEAVTDELLGAWFPILQSAVTISTAGVDRLKRSARLEQAPTGAFRFLGWRQSLDALSHDDLRTIVLSLAQREKGYGVATDILSMRFHSDVDQKKEHSSELLDAGRMLLSSLVFDKDDHTDSHDIYSIAKVCLRGADGAMVAKSLCERIVQGLRNYSFSAFRHEQLLQCIFELQPRIALDEFFGSTPQANSSDQIISIIDGLPHGPKNPLDVIPEQELLQWCNERPAERYPIMARAVSYHVTTKEGQPEWSPIAKGMLERAPDPVAVLEILIRRFSPRSWSGSRAAMIESRLGLLDRLGELKNASLEKYAARIRSELLDTIAQEREWENRRDSTLDERFE